MFSFRTRTPRVRSGQLLTGRHTLDHIAPASLNIATALHAEAIRAVSHGFGGRRVQNAKILHFVEFAEETEGVETPYPWKVFG